MDVNFLTVLKNSLLLPKQMEKQKFSYKAMRVDTF